MMASPTRAQVVERVRATLDARRPVIAAGAGCGLSAKCAELGGADLIVIYNSGAYRIDGLPSIAGYLAYGNANDMVLELGARHVLPAVRATPVIAGVCGTDPTRDIARFLGQVRDAGFAGVINFPTVGRLDGTFRRDLESVGLGFAREVEMIRAAQALDLVTMAYVFTPDESREMAAAGVDLVVPHVGLTAGGTIGATQALGLAEAAAKVQAMIQAARAANPDVVALAHGGPIATPEDVAHVLAHTDAQGFVGASSMERLPVEQAIIGTVERFKALRLS